MINYLPDETQPEWIFTLSYSELRDKYHEICALDDKEFKKRLPEALHLACFICFLKEVPTDVCLSDYGIIHLLAHAIHLPEISSTKKDFKLMHKRFAETLKLA